MKLTAAAAKKSQSPTSKKGDGDDSKSKKESKQDKEDAKMSPLVQELYSRDAKDHLLMFLSGKAGSGKPWD